jgi:MerR family mercuric resistance operon transcriptional regulator
MNNPVTIGFLARAAEVNIETVRYYQRIGLIQEPKKPITGYRVYSNEIIDRLNFIKRAKDLGFSMKEIIELLDLGDGNCRDMQLRAEQKRTLIDQQINDLKKLRKTLDNLIKTCQTETNKVHCPIVETLTGKR